jgi:predicted metalloenzyme YecM
MLFESGLVCEQRYFLIFFIYYPKQGDLYKTILQLLGDPTPFLDGVFAALAKDGIDIDEYELDHICYRVSADRYDRLRQALLPLGELLTEKPINGRPIATFKLHTPLVYRDRAIDCLELPSPKADSPYPEGFEHVELVVPEGLEQFQRRYKHLVFDTKGLHKAINADLRRSYEGFSVKFHEQSLEYVIRYLE